MKLFSSSFFFLTAVILQGCLWFTVKNDPFFGDAIASTSQAASNIYAQHLSTVFYPLYADPGHPTLYAYGLAVCWTLFGKTLWVAHAYSCVWALAFLGAFRKVASCHLSVTETNIATILVMFFPTYLAQSAMMLNTVAVMTFFLLAVYGAYTQQRFIILVAATLMCLTHLQAAFLLLSVACLDVWLSVTVHHIKLWKWMQSRVMIYTIPVCVFGAWLLLHRQHTGWLFLSPHYSDADELNGLSEYAKALALMSWRLVDYGMVPFYVLIGWLFWTQQESRKTIAPFIVMLVPCCLAMAVFLSHTIGHRYFMAFGMMAILYAVYLTRYFKPMGRILLVGCLGVSLLAGNFVYYPGKNLGDATLAYRSYFTLIEQARRAAAPFTVYSHAPIANEDSLTYLHTTTFAPVQRMNDAAFDTLPVILQSNVNAEFSEDDKNVLAHWYGTSFEHGAVYINVFANPKYVAKPDNWVLRQPSGFEQWMIHLKHKAGH